ncbi:MAG: sugar transferase [Opitutales bacterium]|nr:sugar transferase [Opitutales bacterium]
MYRRFFKRFFDIAGSIFILLALSPVFLLVWVLVRVKMGSPAILRQARPGRNEKIFYVMKFRSMTNAADARGNLLPDKDRITPLGKFLRKTSLDELPQIINVLKGDMSFIGPRPLLPRYLPYYTAEEKLRHSIRPGISGLAQVNGRNCISWDEKLAYDVQYAKNVTFWGDFKIGLLTVKKVLCSSDVSTVSDEGFLDEVRGGKAAGK